MAGKGQGWCEISGKAFQCQISTPFTLALVFVSFVPEYQPRGWNKTKPQGGEVVDNLWDDFVTEQ